MYPFPPRILNGTFSTPEQERFLFYIWSTFILLGIIQQRYQLFIQIFKRLLA